MNRSRRKGAQSVNASSTRKAPNSAEIATQDRQSRLSIPEEACPLGRFPVALFLTLRSLLWPVVFGVAGAIFDANGRVLLVQQTYAKGWCLPGGAIDHGEAPEKAVRRELQEELGLSGGRVRLFGLYSRKLWWLTHVVALYVIEDGAIDFHPNREVRAVRWDHPNQPPSGTTPATLRRLAELASGAQQDDEW
jgi:8-oxo-dGTP pyrophosphatase MutT (NUDIX family)